MTVTQDVIGTASCSQHMCGSCVLSCLFLSHAGFGWNRRKGRTQCIIRLQYHTQLEVPKHVYIYVLYTDH